MQMFDAPSVPELSVGLSHCGVRLALTVQIDGSLLQNFMLNLK